MTGVEVEPSRAFADALEVIPCTLTPNAIRVLIALRMRLPSPPFFFLILRKRLFSLGKHANGEYS